MDGAREGDGSAATADDVLRLVATMPEAELRALCERLPRAAEQRLGWRPLYTARQVEASDGVVRMLEGLAYDLVIKTRVAGRRGRGRDGQTAAAARLAAELRADGLPWAEVCDRVFAVVGVRYTPAGLASITRRAGRRPRVSSNDSLETIAITMANAVGSARLA